MDSTTKQQNIKIYFHPGITLAEKLEEIGMKSNEFAIRCGKPIKTISEVLNGKSSITPDMAILFEQVLKIPARFWMNYQNLYDESVARMKYENMLKNSKDWVKQFPYLDMANKGWLPKVNGRDYKNKAKHLLAYFGQASPKAWENYYMDKQLSLAFRISLVSSKSPYAISAWLRQGEIEATTIDAPKFNKSLLKTILPVLRTIMAEHKVGWFKEIQRICLEAGVKVMFTPSLPGAPISGAARWLNGVPVIQVSSRYKRNDRFWFSFFHEIGHIILHGNRKSDVFLEDVDYSDLDLKKETEADVFAAKNLLSKKEEKEILKLYETKDLEKEDIVFFAEKFNTHPGIIVGRLQHLKVIEYREGNDLKEKIGIEDFM